MDRNVSAVPTKNAVSSPYTSALVTFWAGTTVLSRTVATTSSMRSTASVVQSLMPSSPLPSRTEGAYPAGPRRHTSGRLGEGDGVEEPARRLVEDEGLLPSGVGHHHERGGRAIRRRGHQAGRPGTLLCEGVE